MVLFPVGLLWVKRTIKVVSHYVAERVGVGKSRSLQEGALLNEEPMTADAVDPDSLGDKFAQLAGLQEVIRGLEGEVVSHQFQALLKSHLVFEAALYEANIKLAYERAGRPELNRDDETDLVHKKARKWKASWNALKPADSSAEIPKPVPVDDEDPMPSHLKWLSGLFETRNAVVHPSPPKGKRADRIEIGGFPLPSDGLDSTYLQESRLRYTAIGPTFWHLGRWSER